MKLRAIVLITLALLTFSTPMLVKLDVTAPEFHGVFRGTVENVYYPTQPCGDPIDDSEFPH